MHKFKNEQYVEPGFRAAWEHRDLEAIVAAREERPQCGRGAGHGGARSGVGRGPRPVPAHALQFVGCLTALRAATARGEERRYASSTAPRSRPSTRARSSSTNFEENAGATNTQLYRAELNAVVVVDRDDAAAEVTVTP